jgi:hypothetical protein
MSKYAFRVVACSSTYVTLLTYKFWLTSTRYVHSLQQSMVQKGAPYGHPIFAALHAKAFFKTKLSLGNIYPYHFTNLIEGGDPCECEVPLAMLELVAMAVSSYIPLP